MLACVVRSLTCEETALQRSCTQDQPHCSFHVGCSLNVALHAPGPAAAVLPAPVVQTPPPVQPPKAGAVASFSLPPSTPPAVAPKQAAPAPAPTAGVPAADACSVTVSARSRCHVMKRVTLAGPCLVHPLVDGSVDIEPMAIYLWLPV